MISVIDDLIIIAIVFIIGYINGWNRAFRYSDHLDNLKDAAEDE